MALLTAAAGFAQKREMYIHHPNGEVDTIPVENVAKITFGNAGSTDIPDDPQQLTMVDMGLSVKWASCNMGAAKPEEYGNFYAYGEIEPKSEYTLQNYKWINQDWLDYGDEQYDEWERYYKLGATITGTPYDVAHMKLGDKWRMPTQTEWIELINNCTFTWEAIGSVSGIRATSKVNGNSIFFPAAGNYVDDKHTHDGSGCFLWTATEYIQDDISKEVRNYRANLDAKNHSADGYDYPEVGFNVRAVYGDVPVVQPVQNVAEEVDLGLSVKWADRNVGAKGSSSAGDFYCWGEVLPKQYYHTYNSVYYDPWSDTFTDIGQNIGGTQYDAATAVLGEGWRIPTKAEWEELINNCEWTADSYGFTVKGPNGNSIYLRACGQGTYKGLPRESYCTGYYLTSNLREENNKDNGMIYGVMFSRGGGNKLEKPVIKDWLSRAGGLQIRAVKANN